MNRSGVYQILNTVNNKCYVGSASNLRKRKNDHLCALRRGLHYNKRLQRSWNKHGENSFDFVVIEFVDDKNELLKREQFWIDTLDATNMAHGYNNSPTAGSNLGWKATEEMRARNSAAHIGKKPTPQAREKMSIAQRKRISRPHTEETKAKISAARKLRETSDETRVKLSAAKKGKKFSPEHRAALSASRIGITLSEESRRKISETKKGAKASEETREKLSAAMVLRNEKARQQRAAQLAQVQGSLWGN